MKIVLRKIRGEREKRTIKRGDNVRGKWLCN
jgi:hypothetical protein